MLPHVASATLARPVEAHRIVGRLVGAQHRADGRVGVAPVLRRQPFEHPVADQGVVRVEGDDDRLGIRAYRPDCGHHAGEQAAAAPVAYDRAAVPEGFAGDFEMFGEHRIRRVVEDHRSPSRSLLPRHGFEAAAEAARRNVAARSPAPATLPQRRDSPHAAFWSSLGVAKPSQPKVGWASQGKDV